MEEEDNIIGKLKDVSGKIDHKALAGAVGVMLLSWLGLPIVYWLIVRKDAKEGKSREMEKMRDKSKETETSENS